jgi:prepilin signal peptidase PulO-like enzyme (type II secretory pathway)
VLCGGLFLLFYALGFLTYHQEALGFGDPKLAAVNGVIAGWPGNMTTMIIAVVLSMTGIVLTLRLVTATRYTYIPFVRHLPRAGSVAGAGLDAPSVVSIRLGCL